MTVSVKWALRPSMVSVTLAMRRSIASTACAVPSVSEEVRLVRRESIDWITCAAPSVIEVVNRPSRLSMVVVTDVDCVSKVCSSDLSLSFSEASRLATRPSRVVSNCDSRWSIVAVMPPLLVVRRVSKLST